MTSAFLQYQSALYYQANKNYEACKLYAEQGLSIDNRFSEFYVLLGDMASQELQLADAERWYKDAMVSRERPSSPVFVNYYKFTPCDRLSILFYEQGRYAEALYYLKMAMEEKPKDPRLLDNLIWVENKFNKWFEFDKLRIHKNACLAKCLEQLKKIQVVVNKFLPLNGTAFDIGAGSGAVTTYLSRHVGPHGVVFSMEPDLQSYKLLREAVEENSLANTTTFNSGVLPKTEAALYITPEGATFDAQYAEDLKYTKMLQVKTFDIDKFFAQLPSIKLDVMFIQCGEVAFSILNESERTLNTLPSIYVEFDELLFIKYGITKQTLLHLLSLKGYEFFGFDDNLALVPLEETKPLTTFVAVHKSKIA